MMIDGEMTDVFSVAHGVKQDCVLASTLFTRFLAAVLEVSNRDTTKGVYIMTRFDGRLFNVSRVKAKAKVRQLGFRNRLCADDTGFLSHSAVDLQTILDMFAAASTSIGLSINVRKTVVLQQNPRRKVEGERESDKHRGRCGGIRHNREKCPSKDVICNKCKKKVIFGQACRRIKAKRIHEVNEDVEIPFLGEVDEQGDYWSADISMNPTRFKLDTGAGVLVLSHQTPWLKNCQLDKQPVKLRGPGRIQLPVIRTLNREIKETVYVMQTQLTSLLGKAACVSVKID